MHLTTQLVALLLIVVEEEAGGDDENEDDKEEDHQNDADGHWVGAVRVDAVGLGICKNGSKSQFLNGHKNNNNYSNNSQ